MAVWLQYVAVAVPLGLAAAARSREAAWLSAAVLWYAAADLGVLAALMIVKRWTWVLGKDPRNGRVAAWSWVLHAPFHALNAALSWVKRVTIRRNVDAANEVAPNLWVGSRFCDHETLPEWAAVVDLTNEYPERCQGVEEYRLFRTWDGTPNELADLIEGASFILKHRRRGPVVVHCAHGVGRSATMAAAALIVGGEAADHVEALKIIKRARPICRFNAKMTHQLQTLVESIK